MKKEKSINIENIIMELRKEIEEKDYEPIPDFDDMLSLEYETQNCSEPFDMDFFTSEIECVNKTYYINPNVPIEGKFKFIKKVIRKSTYFIAQHLVNAQNEYTTHVTRCLNQMRNFVFEESDKIKLVNNVYESLTGDVGRQVILNSEKVQMICEENYNLKKSIIEINQQLKDVEMENQSLQDRIELLELKFKKIEELHK